MLLLFSPQKKSACFIDVVVGLDVSSQRQGDHIFHGQSQLETYLPQIMHALTSLTNVSCNVGSQSQTSVALKVRNMDPPVTPKFQIDSEKLLNSLVGTTIQHASHLNVDFLDSLWETFQIKSANRRKVVLIFSDGLDDSIEALEHKSEELRKKGLDALITVALQGASNVNDLQYIEFGKGYEYRTQLNIGMRNIASQLLKYVVRKILHKSNLENNSDTGRTTQKATMPLFAIYSLFSFRIPLTPLSYNSPAISLASFLLLIYLSWHEKNHACCGSEVRKLKSDMGEWGVGPTLLNEHVAVCFANALVKMENLEAKEDMGSRVFKVLEEAQDI
ncbi:Collagen alpha-6(VI) chain [Varanus komodoensis]|nr:Collagen alpha-6(VI) chain [Varanus komodoensis]